METTITTMRETSYGGRIPEDCRLYATPKRVKLAEGFNWTEYQTTSRYIYIRGDWTTVSTLVVKKDGCGKILSSSASAVRTFKRIETPITVVRRWKEYRLYTGRHNIGTTTWDLSNIPNIVEKTWSYPWENYSPDLPPVKGPVNTLPPFGVAVDRHPTEYIKGSSGGGKDDVPVHHGQTQPNLPPLVFPISGNPIAIGDINGNQIVPATQNNAAVHNDVISPDSYTLSEEDYRGEPGKTDMTSTINQMVGLPSGGLDDTYLMSSQELVYFLSHMANVNFTQIMDVQYQESQGVTHYYVTVTE